MGHPLHNQIVSNGFINMKTGNALGLMKRKKLRRTVKLKKNTTSKETAMDVLKKNAAQNLSKDIGSNVIYGILCSTKLQNQPSKKCLTG